MDNIWISSVRKARLKEIGRDGELLALLIDKTVKVTSLSFQFVLPKSLNSLCMADTILRQNDGITLLSNE